MSSDNSFFPAFNLGCHTSMPRQSYPRRTVLLFFKPVLELCFLHCKYERSLVFFFSEILPLCTIRSQTFPPDFLHYREALLRPTTSSFPSLLSPLLLPPPRAVERTLPHIAKETFSDFLLDIPILSKSVLFSSRVLCSTSPPATFLSEISRYFSLFHSFSRARASMGMLSGSYYCTNY